MTHMHDIENTVGKGDLPAQQAPAAYLVKESGQIKDFLLNDLWLLHFFYYLPLAGE